MRKPRKTKIVLTGPFATYVFFKESGRVARLDQDGMACQWFSWLEFTTELAVN
jgi:hypothetical protein